MKPAGGLFQALYYTVAIRILLLIFLPCSPYVPLHCCLCVSLYFCLFVPLNCCYFVLLHCCDYISLPYCHFVLLHCCNYMSLYYCHFVFLHCCDYVSLSYCHFVLLHCCHYVSLRIVASGSICPLNLYIRHYYSMCHFTYDITPKNSSQQLTSKWVKINFFIYPVSVTKAMYDDATTSSRHSSLQ